MKWGIEEYKKLNIYENGGYVFTVFDWTDIVFLTLIYHWIMCLTLIYPCVILGFSK